MDLFPSGRDSPEPTLLDRRFLPTSRYLTNRELDRLPYPSQLIVNKPMARSTPQCSFSGYCEGLLDGRADVGRNELPI